MRDTAGQESLLAKIKRRVSISRPRGPSLSSVFTGTATSSASAAIESDNSDEGEPTLTARTKAYSIAPPHHRENTPIHALLDTLPSLPTFPSFPGRNTPRFSAPSSELDGGDEDPDAVATAALASQQRRGSTIKRTYQGDPFKRLTGNVVAVGGYRGSILRDRKTNKRLWIPLKTGLRVRSVDLSIGLSDEDELNSTDTVVASTMVWQILGIVSLGKPLKEKLKSLQMKHVEHPPPKPHAPVRLVNHGYDWRRRLELSSAELIEKLVRLKAESKLRGEGKDGQGEGATVIAHSMGGLVALHALATCKDPTIFKGLIAAGTPFAGTPNILQPLSAGDKLLLNRDVCSPSAVFSMRSSFYMLPRSGLCFESPSGEPMPIDFFDPKAWSDYKLSPMCADLYAPESERKRDRRERWRDRAASASEDRTIGTGLEMNMAEQSIDATLLGRPMTDEPDDDWQGSLPTPPKSGDEASGPVQDKPQLDVPRDSSPAGSSGSSSEDERNGNIERQPSFSELSKILSASDQTIADYLKRTLKRVEQFYADIDNSFDPSKPYPPVVLLTSRKTPTVRGCIMPSRSAIADNPYDQLLFDQGDGIVLHSSSSSLPGPPNAKWNTLVKGVVETNFGHVSMLGDLGAMRECLSLLYG